MNVLLPQRFNFILQLEAGCQNIHPIANLAAERLHFTTGLAAAVTMPGWSFWPLERLRWLGARPICRADGAWSMTLPSTCRPTRS